MVVHPVAERGFGSTADLYERARPGYPGVVDVLRAELDLGPDRVVLDLAAGTGKLTRELVPAARRVVAVEPLPDMRAQLAAAVPAADVLDGTAEAIPLPDGSVDLVTVASAFHWFDGERALADIHRVLRPSGGLVLVWNQRDESVDWVARAARLVETAVRDSLGPSEVADAERAASDAWRAVFDRTPLFAPLESRELHHEHVLDVAGHVERFLSVAYVAVLPDERRRRFAAELEQLLRTHPETRGRRRFGMPYTTVVFWTRPLG